MRTVINIEDASHQKIKELAKENKMTMSSMINQSIEYYLSNDYAITNAMALIAKRFDEIKGKNEVKICK
jgi:predicted DNA-binding ribbon-helix-helix protein